MWIICESGLTAWIILALPRLLALSLMSLIGVLRPISRRVKRLSGPVFRASSSSSSKSASKSSVVRCESSTTTSISSSSPRRGFLQTESGAKVDLNKTTSSEVVDDEVLFSSLVSGSIFSFSLLFHFILLILGKKASHLEFNPNLILLLFFFCFLFCFSAIRGMSAKRRKNQRRRKQIKASRKNIKYSLLMNLKAKVFISNLKFS